MDVDKFKRDHLKATARNMLFHFLKLPLLMTTAAIWRVFYLTWAKARQAHAFSGILLVTFFCTTFTIVFMHMRIFNSFCHILTSTHVLFFSRKFFYNYTVSPKKRPLFIFSITQSKINRF